MLLPLSLISILFIKNKKYGTYITVNLILATIINIILKLIFIRERPLDGIITETGYSYPSGHSFVSFAFYGFLVYLITKSNLTKRTKIFFTSLLIVLIPLIGLSRVYLGVHYPSDVLGGFIGGAIYLLIYIEIIKKIEGVKNEEEKQRK